MRAWKKLEPWGNSSAVEALDTLAVGKKKKPGFMWILFLMYVCWEDHRTTVGVGIHRPPCITTGSLVAHYCRARLTSLPTSSEFLASASCLPVGDWWDYRQLCYCSLVFTKVLCIQTPAICLVQQRINQMDHFLIPWIMCLIEVLLSLWLLLWMAYVKILCHGSKDKSK